MHFGRLRLVSSVIGYACVKEVTEKVLLLITDILDVLPRVPTALADGADCVELNQKLVRAFAAEADPDFATFFGVPFMEQLSKLKAKNGQGSKAHKNSRFMTLKQT